MGLFFGKSSSAPKFNKYKMVGQSSSMEILKQMNPRDRTKLTDQFKALGTSQKSIHQITKDVGEKYGYEMKKKFLKAAEKHFSGGLTAKEKARNLKLRMQRDLSALEETGIRTEKSVLGKVGGGVKGTTDRLGIRELGKKSGFAGQNKMNNTPASSPKLPNKGTRPLGF